MESLQTIEAVQTDSALVADLRRGEAGAVERLLREHGAGLLSLARSLTRCDQQAQDVVQEAVIRALRSIDTLERPEALRAWLHRITANCALQALRSRARRRERPIEALLPIFRNDGHREGVRDTWSRRDACSLEREETRQAVRTAIDQLPDPYREIVMLRDLIGFDTEETAMVLGITQNLAKVRLHRARQALRTLLEEEFGS